MSDVSAAADRLAPIPMSGREGGYQPWFALALPGAPLGSDPAAYASGSSPDFEGKLPSAAVAELRALICNNAVPVEVLIMIIVDYLYVDALWGAYETELAYRLATAPDWSKTMPDCTYEHWTAAMADWDKKWAPWSRMQRDCPGTLAHPHPVGCRFMHVRLHNWSATLTHSLSSVRFDVSGSPIDQYGWLSTPPIQVIGRARRLGDHTSLPRLLATDFDGDAVDEKELARQPQAELRPAARMSALIHLPVWDSRPAPPMPARARRAALSARCPTRTPVAGNEVGMARGILDQQTARPSAGSQSRRGRKRDKYFRG